MPMLSDIITQACHSCVNRDQDDLCAYILRHLYSTCDGCGSQGIENTVNLGAGLPGAAAAPASAPAAAPGAAAAPPATPVQPAAVQADGTAALSTAAPAAAAPVLFSL